MINKIIILFFITCTFFKMESQSIAGSISGTQTYCDTLNSGFLTLTGNTGNVVTWLVSVNNGTTWVSNGNTLANQSYYHLTKTTCYKVVVKNGTFPNDTSAQACMVIYKPTVGGTVTANASFCSISTAETLTLTGSLGAVLNWEYSTNNGTTWTPISNTTTLNPYSNITQTTEYRAQVQNSSFCLQKISNTVTVNISPNTVSGALNIIPTNTVCYGINNSKVKINGSVGAVIDWLVSSDNGTTWTNLAVTVNSITATNLISNKLYKAILQSGICPADTTAAQQIYVLPQTTVSAGTDLAVSEGQTIQLNGAGIGVPLWAPAATLNNPSILNPIANPVNNTNYILTITDSKNCQFSDTVFVVVLSASFNGVITNLFSPNGDGINDFWYIENIQFYKENEVLVYNIYGQLVYTKQGYANDWDGTYNGAPLPDGTYYYVVKSSPSSTLLKSSLDILRGK